MGRGDAVAITGWGVLSSIGLGTHAFTSAWKAGRNGIVDVSEGFSPPLPMRQACPVTGFSASDYLGRKGTSFFDRTTALAVVTCGEAISDSDADFSDQRRNRTGVSLASTTGGVESICNFSAETMINDKPYMVNPKLFPYAVMNAAASSAAIWHRLKSVNATVSNGQVSFLSALRYSRNALRSGHADTMLTGGVEELTSHRAWAAHTLRGSVADRVPLGEGCVMFALERGPGRRAGENEPLGEILSVEVGLAGGSGRESDAEGFFTQIVTRAMREAEVSADEIACVAGSVAGSPTRDALEFQAVSDALGREVEWLPVKQRLGETYSASGAFQLGALLAEVQSRPALRAMPCLITSVASEGLVAAAVVKGFGRAGASAEVTPG